MLQAVASARSAENKAAMTSKRLAAIPGVSSNIVAEIVAGSGMAPSGVEVLPATAASKHGTTVRPNPRFVAIEVWMLKTGAPARS